MTGGYVLVAGILLYIFLLQKLDSPAISPVKAAFILIGGYWVLSSVISSMLYTSWGVPAAENLFSSMNIATAVVQFIIAVGVFYKVEQSGDEYLSHAFWGGLGLALIFFVAPKMAGWLFSTVVL